jgi:hypothetical protein
MVGLFLTGVVIVVRLFQKRGIADKKNRRIADLCKCDG